MAKKGNPQDAAELCLASGLLDEAVRHFEAAEEYSRTAEIRHDQNRFLESAELYVRAGNFESAGTILASQREFVRAADCYMKAGRYSVAAEMFEKAGDLSRAGDCYRKAGFHRHAAQAYVRTQRWDAAAEALEEGLADEATQLGQDTRKQQEHRKLVLQTARLYEQAGKIERAQGVLERAGSFGAAAELAARRGEFARAAEYYLKAGDPPRAADALRQLGQDQAASRVLGQYHRDRDEDHEAARHLEAAGEFVDAGDLYRKLEQYERAGACYERQGEAAQAAEMFRLAGDDAHAAANYEEAGHFLEAAECYAGLGDSSREAAMLARAGRLLQAGEIYHRQNEDEEAIKVLQQVRSDHPDFAGASALLGAIFRARGLHSLAIKKLVQAIGDTEIGRENIEAYYELATVYEANQEFAKAADLYEKILAVDYHHGDVQERLSHAREQVRTSPASAASEPKAPGEQGAGSRPGRYQILGELGRGGMGIVYKARDTVLDRMVAYKVLPDALKENPQALRNFLREAKSAAQLNHPNIVTVYDAGEQDGRYYIAMEYVDGTTLKEILRRRKVISPNASIHVLLQMCEGLSYAHEKKIVHRDVKTANTMWTRDRKAKIMDFGLAKVVEEVRNHTTMVSGTPYYMSPEQTLGRNVDHRTDIYSLGVTLFELATGTLPFREGNVPYHHVHTPAPDPREVNPELPLFLAEIISRCLQKEPDARYQSAREVIADVRATLTQGRSSGNG
jgi:tetratricopeptide (TPR) repeat protein